MYYCAIKLQNKTIQTHNQPFKDKSLYTYFYFFLHLFLSFLYVEPNAARPEIFWLQILISPAT
jgi:hypothetical protein